MVVISLASTRAEYEVADTVERYELEIYGRYRDLSYINVHTLRHHQRERLPAFHNRRITAANRARSLK